MILELIGAATRLLGHLSMLDCMAGGGWLLWQMFRHPNSATMKDEC